jgi:soluble lytic murein transglycosylase-like protein
MLCCLPVLAQARALQPDCVDAAARHHGVNARVLQAVAWHESRWRADAVAHNANGTTDHGAFQINSVHLPELQQQGIGTRELMDPCLSAYVGAWHLARQMRSLGNNWAAVGAYHSRTPARQRWYANQIAGVLMQWRVIPVGPLPYRSADTLPPGSR